jgi:aminoglycoside phosphotransferase family enzyme
VVVIINRSIDMKKKKEVWSGKGIKVRIRTGHTDLSGREIKLTEGLIATLIRSVYNQPIVYVEEIK